MPSANVHHATLVVLAASTAHVMSVAGMAARVASRHSSRGCASASCLKLRSASEQMRVSVGHESRQRWPVSLINTSG
jgi:hypothetical protein